MRSIGLDLSRGCLIIYIIIVIHGVFWLGLIPRPYSTILLLEMPLIFLISGYAFALATKNKREIDLYLYWNYAKVKVARIVIPYLLYASACAFLMIFKSKDPNYSEIIISWLNPLSYGKGNSAYWLNDHLWFIPPFLFVTLLLPVCKIKLFAKIPINNSLFLLFLIYCLLSLIESEMVTPIFYFIWAYLGFKLGSGLKINRKKLLLIATIGILILIVAGFAFNANLDMQTNKFPPNFFFLVFSIVWVSLTLLITSKMPPGFVNIMARNKAVSIFISYGYTLYLWQGMGYSMAGVLRNKIGINIIGTWFIAIFATIILGFLASPMEKIRWKHPLS